MTSQEKKEYLRRYREADNEIEDLLREKEKIITRMTRVTASQSSAPIGCDQADRMTDGVAKLIELEKEIDAKVSSLVDLRREIMSAINSIDSNMQRRLLKLRYIDGMTWARIAAEMNADLRWIYRIHGRALFELTIESHH